VGSVKRQLCGLAQTGRRARGHLDEGRRGLLRNGAETAAARAPAGKYKIRISGSYGNDCGNPYFIFAGAEAAAARAPASRDEKAGDVSWRSDAGRPPRAIYIKHYFVRAFLHFSPRGDAGSPPRRAPAFRDAKAPGLNELSPEREKRPLECVRCPRLPTRTSSGRSDAGPAPPTEANETGVAKRGRRAPAFRSIDQSIDRQVDRSI
jgi:hypothetical protein